ncbi:GNAT family N-acetyltransferase [soil metagenome]
MPDMLCSLLQIPPIGELLEHLRAEDIYIRRPNPWEQTALREFITAHFSQGWADETSVAFAHQPVTAFVAMQRGKIIGFAAYECSRRDYFGPTGVDPALRGKGVGKALFLAALHGLRELGYTYAVIGDAGPVNFYRACSGAIDIPFGDGKGVYTLKEDPGISSLK